MGCLRLFLARCLWHPAGLGLGFTSAPQSGISLYCALHALDFAFWCSPLFGPSSLILFSPSNVHQTLALQLQPEPEVPNMWREDQVLSVDKSFLSLHTVSESQEISLDEGFFVCSFFCFGFSWKEAKDLAVLDVRFHAADRDQLEPSSRCGWTVLRSSLPRSSFTVASVVPLHHLPGPCRSVCLDSGPAFPPCLVAPCYPRTCPAWVWEPGMMFAGKCLWLSSLSLPPDGSESCQLHSGIICVSFFPPVLCLLIPSICELC